MPDVTLTLEVEALEFMTAVRLLVGVLGDEMDTASAGGNRHAELTWTDGSCRASVDMS